MQQIVISPTCTFMPSARVQRLYNRCKGIRTFLLVDNFSFTGLRYERYDKKNPKHQGLVEYDEPMVVLSPETETLYPDTFEWWNIQRDDVLLARIVKKLGPKASHGYDNGRLIVVEIPDDVEWVIEADSEMGSEWVAEKHRVWYGDEDDASI